MSHAENIPGPVLCVSKSRAERNIERMVAKCQRAGITLRPHFKTHQSLEVAGWFREQGVTRCTVSSPAMARQFAAGGWGDITIAFPAQPGALEVYNELASEVHLALITDNECVVRKLSDGLTHEVSFWIEIDAGYGRTGVAWDDVDALTALAHCVESSPNLILKGVLTHAGDSYSCRGVDEISACGERSMGALASACEVVSDAVGRKLLTSYGDTPTCVVLDEFPNIDELRPGNFVFFDLTQYDIGSCSLDEIAVSVACPVVGIYPERNQVVVHGGAVHFSKDVLEDGSYGRVLIDRSMRSSAANIGLKSLSQEHGTIDGAGEWMNDLNVGDVLHILPVHSCLTADCFQGRYVCEA
ncbi:MAG: alanine racemase [Akkermansiaceae bacterium]